MPSWLGPVLARPHSGLFLTSLAASSQPLFLFKLKSLGILLPFSLSDLPFSKNSFLLGTTYCFTLFDFSLQHVLLCDITSIFISPISYMFSPPMCKLHDGLESILIWVLFGCSVSFYPFSNFIIINFILINFIILQFHVSLYYIRDFTL